MELKGKLTLLNNILLQGYNINFVGNGGIVLGVVTSGEIDERVMNSHFSVSF
jgi:hypothetical protein